METVSVIVNSEFSIGEIDKRMYGSFLEHMGRVIYSGIYEPEHELADEDGFRTDVLKAVQNMGITQVRYPGGNFVSCYHWEDGVGPREERPRRVELAWKAIETNEFGTNEFMKWIKKAGAEPMLAVNLGTRGTEEALQYLEYCNFPKGTSYSDLRRKHGIENPYGVKAWCLGNEMDGSWQIGHKTAEEYGKLAAETAKVMKLLDPSIEVTVCGSSLNTMETFPEWEREVLEQSYEQIDYISLHQYFAGQEKGTEGFLAQADEIDAYIKAVTAACDFVKAKKGSDKTVYISFDEWGVWSHSSEKTVEQCNETPWQEAPAISEMIYTFEDALLFGGMLLALLKNADRVKMACQSLLTNISSCIMTEKGGEMWLQPTYYPFCHVANYGRGKVLKSILKCEKKSFIDCVVVYNEEKKELVIFAINRSAKEMTDVEILLQDLECRQIVEHMVMECEDLKTTNEVNHEAVVPHSCNRTRTDGKRIWTKLAPVSWNMIRIEIK